MKNTAISYLICACLVLSAFLGGLFVGRNMGSEVIHTEKMPSFQQDQSSTPDSDNNGSSSSDSSSAGITDGKVNINTASLEVLMTLDGIGETFAQRIIDYRNANGPFNDIYEILNVAGIGAKRFEAIMDQITVGG